MYLTPSLVRIITEHKEESFSAQSGGNTNVFDPKPGQDYH